MSDIFVYTTAIKKLRKLNKRIKVVPGGTSAGKTFGILPILIDKCTKESGLEVSVVSESIPHLRRGAMKDFLKIMRLTNRYIDSNWNRSLLTYKFASGSYIEFFSADQDDKLRGARRTHLYVNEANNVSFDAYHQLAIRTSKEIWLDFNPTAAFWAHENISDDKDADWLTLTYKDNEALPESIVTEIEKAKEKAKTSEYWRNWWAVYGLGQIGSLQGTIFNNYEVIDILPSDAKCLGSGIDFGFTNDPTAVIDLYQYNGKIILDECVYEKGLLNKQIADRLNKRHNYIADSAEPKSIQEIKAYGYTVKGAVKGKDSILFGIQLMQEYDFLITKKSTNLIKEFRYYCWDKNRQGETLNKPIDDYNHGMDAIRYIMTAKFGNKRSGNYSIGGV
jgi:phage terminase large subunit